MSQAVPGVGRHQADLAARCGQNRSGAPWGPRALALASRLAAGLALGLLALAWPAAGARADGPTVSLSGAVVSRADGSPIANAIIFVDQQRIQADQRGQWQAQVPVPANGARIYRWAFAPGYRPAQGWYAFDQPGLPTPGPLAHYHVGPVTGKLLSAFGPDQAEAYAWGGAGAVAPAITAFSGDAGGAFTQVLPPQTRSLTVAGTTGRYQGKGLVADTAFLAKPDDFVEQVPVAITGGAFKATFPIQGGPGRYQVEVNDTFGQALINVAVFVGVPYVAGPPRVGPGAAPGPTRAEALAGLNELRQRHRLPAVQIDPRLQRVAEDHVADTVAHMPPGHPCHCWSDGGTLETKVAAAGVRPAQLPVPGKPNATTLGVGEGFTVGTTGRAAVDQLFDSPAHRRDLLGDYTHVGIADGATGGHPFLVIEYAKEVGPVPAQPTTTTTQGATQTTSTQASASPGPSPERPWRPLLERIRPYTGVPDRALARAVPPWQRLPPLARAGSFAAVAYLGARVARARGLLRLCGAALGYIGLWGLLGQVVAYLLTPR